jgi:YVTN family beta-propeller protein
LNNNKKALVIIIVLLMMTFSSLGNTLTQAATTKIPVGGNPYAVISVNGYLYVTLINDNAVAVIDTSTKTVIKTITLPGIGSDNPNPYALVYDSYDNKIFVGEPGIGSVAVIDPTSNTVTATIVIGDKYYGTGWGICYNSVNHHIYVTNLAGSVTEIDGSTNTVVNTITLYSGLRGILFNPTNGYLYVCRYEGGWVYVLDPNNPINGTRIADISVNGALYAAYDPVDNRIFVTSNNGYFYAIAASTNTAYGGWRIYGGAQIAYNPINGYLYITGSGVYVYNPANIQQITYIPQSDIWTSEGVAVDSSGTVYVTGHDGSVNYFVAVIELASSPTVSISPSSWTIDVGQSKTFAATASGGSGTYTSYQWYVGGAAQSGQTSSTFTYTASSAGAPSITVTVTDSLGATSAQSTAPTVTVNTALATPSTPSASASTIGQGQSTTLTGATGSGGTSPYSYQWLQQAPGAGSYSSITGATSNSYTFSTTTSTATGVWNFELRITDSASTPTTLISAPVSVTVNTPVAASVSPSTWTMDLDQSKVFTANTGAGAPPYSYAWFVDYGATSGTSSTFSFTPSAAGAHTVSVTVTDSLGGIVGSYANVVVYSALVTPTASPSANIVTQGQTSTLSSTAISTGTAPYNYQWLEKAPGVGSYSAISGATLSSYSFVTSGSTATGVWSFELQVTDSASSAGIVTSSPISVTVNSPLTVSVTPSTWPMDLGQSKTFTASASSGSGSYTSYQWYVGGVAQSGQTSSTFTYTPGSTGSPSITVTVTDSLGETSAQSNAPAVTVTTTLAAPATSTSASSVTQGQTSTLSASGITTGSSPYSYQWFNQQPGASVYAIIVGGTSSSYSFVTSTSTTVGIWNFILQTTDNAGAAVNSTALSVTVSAPVATPTPAPTSNPTQAPVITPRPTATSTPHPTVSPTPQPTATPTPTPSPVSSGLSSEALIVIGGTSAAIVVIFLILLVFRRKKKKNIQ